MNEKLTRTQSSGRRAQTANAAARNSTTRRASEATADQPVAPREADLLERSRVQWQYGDWEVLGKLERDTLLDHPDRAQLALLAAAGHLQTGSQSAARRLARLALEWGCSRKLLSQILIAGVHNSLACAYMANGQDERAQHHFEDSISVAFPKTDRKFVGEARAVHEACRMGLLPQASRLTSMQLATVKQEAAIDKSRLKILEAEIELLHHELSLAQQRQQLFPPRNVPDDGLVEANSAEKRHKALKQTAVSQLGQDLWVLEKTGYKRGGYFVEFGATDGVLLSNTWLLEKEFSWQGICAEPNPKFYSQLQKNRQCRVSDQYIGRETGQEVQFILADVYGGSQEFAAADQHKAKRDAYAAAGHVAVFTAISLDSFLEQHGAPRDIDYISIDTEGSEYDILSSFPFEKWNIRLLTIEHNFTPQREKIRELLERHGYRCIEQKWDDWYESVN